MTFDLSRDPRRLRLLLDADAIASIPHVAGDITEPEALDRALAEHEITQVIHLAALQVPFVRADPPLGARVNVVGFVNVFEAAKRHGLGSIVYASSIAALDLAGGMAGLPTTLYGAFKRANEHCAHVYFAEDGIASIGLRPHIVYGVGRDQGISSGPTAAMLAAAAGTGYRIPYGGACQLQFARDVARAFVAAADASAEGATVHNLPGRRTAIADVVAAIGSPAITFEDVRLPFPEEVDSASFSASFPDVGQTPLEEGVRATIERFRQLLAEGLVTAA